MTKQKIIEQVMAIRDTGRVNMCLAPAVQLVAYEMGYYALVLWIEEHKKIYWNFIMTGQFDYEEEDAE
ncbi:hypothetical protein FACS1894184_09430 [Clostridia bacterium]|nr:hypothetical protein FACS1894184_09430 [Clostridia bacterium]